MRRRPPVSAVEGSRETGRFPAIFSSPFAAISAARTARRDLNKGAREGNMVSLTGARNARDAKTGGGREEEVAA
jgi:hypothetical protein